MNISYRWLRAIAPTIADSPERIAERLGMLGAPVDERIDLGAGLEGIVIARVEAVAPHPNADRLRLCTVDGGGGTTVQVVCGAPNVEAGRYYPFAPIGSTLPGGMEIRKAKLRGERSEGMLCSARELGLGRDHAGLMTLAGEWEPGVSFLRALELEDTRLVVDITPNRPDLLSHIGMARELAPGGAADIVLTPFGPAAEPEDVVGREAEHDHPRAPGSGSAADPADLVRGDRKVETPNVAIAIEDPIACPRYMAAVVEGVRIAPSPEWLAGRLRAIGVRPINNVVDATNYVLHELGQPLHAFDLDRLAGPRIVVRRARGGESIRTLDGVDRALDPTAIVIADRDRPVAVAGIMGGEESEVSDGTTRILLECALFDPRSVRSTARGFGLSTDASHRFERGVDPEGVPRALWRVLELITTVAGGRISGPAIDVHAAPAQRAVLEVRPPRIRQLLGIEIAPEEVGALLEPIGFGVRADGGRGTLTVEVPPYRPDVTREIDVIEEVARRRGYDSFDAELGYARAGRVPSDALFELQSSIHRLLAAWGFLEARTAAFTEARESRVPLLNPLSAEESHLRDALTPGLLRRLEHNWAHGVRAVRLYEIGAVFNPSGTAIPGEETRLAAVFTGPSRPPHWSGPTPSWDAWDLKGLAAEVARLFGGRIEPGAVPSGNGSAGAARFDVLSADGAVLGSGVRVAAGMMDAPAWAEDVWSLEVRLPTARDRPALVYRPLPTFPAAERDLALLLPEGVTAASVEALVRRQAGALLEEVWPFDLYEGKGIPEGTRSVAWRLRFRAPERTLTDEEVEGAIRAVVKALEEELNVRRR